MALPLLLLPPDGSEAALPAFVDITNVEGDVMRGHRHV